MLSTLGGVQYIGGGGGYFEYIVKCSVDQRNIIIHDGDITTTKGDVQYIGGMSSVHWRNVISISEGYHKPCRGDK